MSSGNIEVSNCNRVPKNNDIYLSLMVDKTKHQIIRERVRSSRAVN